MKALKRMREMICEELEQVAGMNRISPSSIDYAQKLTDTYKNILKIEMLEEGDYSRADGEYSNKRYSRSEGYSNDGYSRDKGYSNDDGYSQRRGHYVRAHYSRDDAKSHMVHKLEDLMRSAETDEQRDAIEKCLSQLDNMG